MLQKRFRNLLLVLAAVSTLLGLALFLSGSISLSPLLQNPELLVEDLDGTVTVVPAETASNTTTAAVATPAAASPLAVAREALEMWQSGFSARTDWSMPLPSLIHLTWKTRDSLPSLGEECLAKWRALNPDHTVLLWTDYDALSLVRGYFPHLTPLYRALPRGVMRADLFRYLVLATFGGVYADIDVCPLKPVSAWIPREHAAETALVVGVESDTDRPDWALWYSRQLQLCQWTIAAVPGHAVLAGVVAESTRRLRAKWDAGRHGWPADTPDKIIELTGPAVFTDVALAYMARFGDTSFAALHNLPGPRRFGDVLLNTITAFSPGVGHMNAGEPSDPRALAQHMFLGSWKKEAAAAST
ncbi:hypothetical protein H9P43_008111 [Blastocladiella emersonii ATCC 22665]|nr:hypothetical protein H9P43_008111 [Blastocladiella emersonii ATCC 22665]